MFERTALPPGPRVISARLPGARSVSIAAYVLAGSRLETRRPGRRRPFHGAPHVQGHDRLPVDPGDQRGDRGRRRLVQRGDRPRVDRLLGPRPAPRGRPGDGRPRRADRPADGSRTTEIESERTVIVEEIRSYLDDPSEYCPDPVPDRDVRRRAARPRDLRRRGGHPGPARGRRSATSGGRAYRPANTVVAVAGDLDHDEAVDLAGDGVRDRQRRVSRGSRPPRRCPPAPRLRSASATRAQAQLCLGVPALHRDHPDSWTLAVLNAVLGDGMSSRLFLSVREERGLAYDVVVGARRLRRCRRARGLGRGRSRPGCRRPSRRSSPSSPGCATSASRDDELEKAKRYLAGGLELRMDDTRHVASWIGGQEALHDRVLTLDEALAAVEAVDAPTTSSGWPASCSGTMACGWPRSPRHATCAGSRHASGCRHDRDR